MPYLLAVLLYLLMALFQRRFAEGLAAPMAVLLGVWLSHLTRSLPERRLLHGLLALALALPLVSHPNTVSSTLTRSDTGPHFLQTLSVERERGLRGLCAFLGTHGTDEEAVLAQWDLGHMIEWGATRPTGEMSRVCVAAILILLKFCVLRALPRAVLWRKTRCRGPTRPRL